MEFITQKMSYAPQKRVISKCKMGFIPNKGVIPLKKELYANKKWVLSCFILKFIYSGKYDIILSLLPITNKATI